MGFTASLIIGVPLGEEWQKTLAYESLFDGIAMEKRQVAQWGFAYIGIARLVGSKRSCDTETRILNHPKKRQRKSQPAAPTLA